MNSSRPAFVKKIAALVVAFAIVFSIAPRPVQAADYDSPIQVARAIITSVSTAAIQSLSNALNIKEFTLDGAAVAIGRIAIQSIVRSTVNWINTGFQGSPAFATDLRATIQDAADQATNDFFNQLENNLEIESPFQNEIAQSVLRAYYIGTNADSFFIRNPYTLNRVSDDPAAFSRGDIRQGGLRAWTEAVLNPQNNYLGARQLLQSELDRRVAAVGAQLHEEVANGGGFFSWRRCDLTSTTFEGSGNTTTGSDGTVNIDLTPHQTCLASHIETPGSVLAGQINHSLGLGTDELVQADEINELVNALMGQLMQQVVGATGLAGLSRGSTATGGRDYFTQPDTQSTTQASSGIALAGTSAGVISEKLNALQSYYANWQAINAAAQAAKGALQNSTCTPNSATIISTQINPILAQAAQVIGSTPQQIAALDTIRTTIINSATLSASAQAAAIGQANTSYDAFLRANTRPTPSDLLYAEAQAQPTSTNGTTIVMQMNQLAAQAQCGT
jgi:hypothetical protein